MIVKVKPMKAEKLSFNLYIACSLFAVIVCNSFIFGQNLSFDEDMVIERIKKDISILASDSLLGRESGTKGEEMAYEYIISEFKKVGIAPLPNLNGYLQAFEIQNKNKIIHSELLTNDTSFSYKIDYFVVANSANAQIKKESIVFDKEILLNSDSSQLHAIEDKIVIVFSNSENQDAQAMSMDRFDELEKMSAIAYKQGAKGLIILTNKALEYNFLQGISSYMEGEPIELPVFIVKPQLHPFFSKENRIYTLSLQTQSQKIRAHNVIGFIDNKARYTVVIGAHYDHLGMGNFGSRYMAGQAIHNGADDNASGVASVLEIARYVKINGFKQYNYLFIAFAAEEMGLFGSKHFCKSQIIDLNRVNYMINFDMVGRMRKLRNKLFVLGVNTGIEFRELLKNNKYESGRLSKYKHSIDASDHAYFWKKQVPYLYFTTGLHSDYHTPSDDTQYINFKGVAKTVNYVEEIMSQLDKKDKITYQHPGKARMIAFLWMYLP